MGSKTTIIRLVVMSVLAAVGSLRAAVNSTYVTYTQMQVAGGFGAVSAEAIDAAGNVYIVATPSGSPTPQVWKETPTNGTYTQTAITTAATGAQGIAVDTQGDLFISDYVTNSIFKETVAGTGYSESTAVSGLNVPIAVAVDAGGNLYVIDGGANTLVKETLSGGTYAPSIITSNLNNAEEIAVDAGGNVYVADAGNNRVLKETLANGTYTESIVGTGLVGPGGVAVNSSGVLYIADTQNVRVLTETLVNGSYVQAVSQGPNSSTQNTGLAVSLIQLDGNGVLYYSAHTSVGKSIPNALAEAATINFGSAPVAGGAVTQSIIFTFDAGGTLASPPYVSTQGDLQLDFVASATQATGACVAGTTYATGATCTVAVAFSPTHPGWRYGAVVLYGAAGSPIGTAYLQGTGTAPQVNFSPGTLYGGLAANGDFVSGVAVDGARNAAYVDGSASAAYVLSYASPPPLAAPARIENFSNFVPSGIGLDGAGNLFFVDGTGSVDEGTLAPGVGANQYMLNDSTFGGTDGLSITPGVALTTDGVKIDGSGNVFIASGNRFGGAVSATSTAFVETFTHGGYAQTTLGSGLNNTTGLAVDGNGAVYLLDQGNSRVVKETPAGGTYMQSVLFSGLTASNTDIAVDGLGNLYIPNGSNILKQTLANGSYTASTLALVGLNGPTATGNIVVDGSGNVLFTQVYGGTGEIVLSVLDSGDAPTINFASTTVGATSSDSPHQLSIVNNGNSTLTFAAPPTAANPAITAGFTLSPNTTCPLLPGSTASLTLAPGASCDLYINFAPTTAGNITGTLTVTDDSLNAPGATQVIHLGGAATGASTPPPSAALTPASSNYGTVTAGSSAAATFTLTNTGTVSVAIASASVPTGPFSVASTTCGTSLSAAASCVYVLKFSPTAAGAASATFSVTDDAGTQTAALTGNGAAMAAVPNATLIPASAAFGNIQVGSTSAAQTLTLKSTGTAALTIASIDLGGPNAADFAIATNGCGTTLAGGASCAVTVTYSPTAASASTATLTITDNAATTPQTAALSGTGTPDDFGITASPPAQSIAAGTSATYTVDVTSVSGTFADAVSLSATGLPAGANAVFSPNTLTPGSAGGSSTLTISTATLAADRMENRTWPWGAPLVAAMFFIPWSVGRRATSKVSCLLLAVVIAALPGCGNGGYALPQTANTPKLYTVTITGTSGSLQHSTTVQLTVQ